MPYSSSGTQLKDGFGIAKVRAFSVMPSLCKVSNAYWFSSSLLLYTVILSRSGGIVK